MTIHIPLSAQILIVDDMQGRHQWFERTFSKFDRTHVFTFYNALDAMNANDFDVVFLDHDLNDNGEGDVEVDMYGSRELTGADIALWMVEQSRIPKQVIVHSMNTIGASNIVNIIEGHCPIQWIPFTQLRSILK